VLQDDKCHEDIDVKVVTYHQNQKHGWMIKGRMLKKDTTNVIKIEDGNIIDRDNI